MYSDRFHKEKMLETFGKHGEDSGPERKCHQQCFYRCGSILCETLTFALCLHRIHRPMSPVFHTTDRLTRNRKRAKEHDTQRFIASMICIAAQFTEVWTNAE